MNEVERKRSSTNMKLNPKEIIHEYKNMLEIKHQSEINLLKTSTRKNSLNSEPLTQALKENIIQVAL